MKPKTKTRLFQCPACKKAVQLIVPTKTRYVESRCFEAGIDNVKLRCLSEKAAKRFVKQNCSDTYVAVEK